MSFTALLLGNDSLTSQCGDILLKRGHVLQAVVTRAPEVRKWAEAAGLRVEPFGPDLAQRLPEADWLFSVANLSLVPDAVLHLARKGAVNFHDGPLPRHAGLNAPVWALLEGDTQHGITWHLIEGGVDEGAILEQRLFDIAPGETALTLNSRCFEAGLDSFPALVAQLEVGLRPQAQDPERRSLHLPADRPRAMARLDLSRPAAEAVRLVRALDHGRYWNPLCTAKIDTGSRVLNVGAAELAEGEGAPGTVLSASPAGLVVACGQGAVRLSRLTCQERGAGVCPSTVTETALPLLSEVEADRLTAALAAVAPRDAALHKALAALAPLGVAGARPETGPARWTAVPLAAPLAEAALGALRALGAKAADLARAADGLPGHLAHWEPLRLSAQDSIGAARAAVEAALAQPAPGWPLDLMTRDPVLAGLPVPGVAVSTQGPVAGSVVTLTPGALLYDAARLPAEIAEPLARRIDHVAAQIATRAPEVPLAALSALSEAERDLVLNRWNATARARDRNLTLPEAFAAQVARTPDAPALCHRGTTLSYAQLDARANRVAHVLAGMGVHPGTLVGLCLRRGPDLAAGALGILKAGGAYVPMDPAYTPERLALIADDSACPVIVTQSDLTGRLPTAAQTLCLDTDGRISLAPASPPRVDIAPVDPAYMIYTSGSTGRPKGVVVEHRNVANFFTGLDDRLGTAPGTWLAVTSLSFDISVAELFWPLARGFKVVLADEPDGAGLSSGRIASDRKMDFSLYYWGNDNGPGPKKYELLLEGARFADRNGFCAVWTPERHFHAFGGPYPNPSVTGAAVAAVTSRIGVRSGSVLLPLHHPVRVAEEWAVIDNLTNGRAGLGIASGWHPDDFVLRPENAPPRNKAAMYAAADQIRRLWRGEGVEFDKPDGSRLTVHTLPRPVSPELELWLTSAGNPETWREAGEMGAHVLTHLLGQTIDELAGKIRLYRDALERAGHDPARFKVALMLHTCVGRDRDQVRRLAEGPMKAYLGASADLVREYAWTFPAFRKPPGATAAADLDIRALSPEDTSAILDYAFNRYFEDSGLFGTVEDALARVEQLKRIGVDEVACLIDYGIAPERVLEGLYPLAEVVRRANAGGAVEADDFSLAAQIIRHGVTHLQCTPSLARMLLASDDARTALGRVQTLLLGGEPLTGALAAEVHGATGARLLNMYGPTETTVWSTAEEVAGTPDDPVVGIGRPLPNQRAYVLDATMEPVPPGVVGELWIGGEGVARGYWEQPALTQERFRQNPFHQGRMYRTGDLARWRPDGRLDFVGRADHQVKLRGHRIELGEIEAALARQPGVTQAAVLLREDAAGDPRLVAYVTGPAREAALLAALSAELPAPMVPSQVVVLDSMPLTPNRKIDRKALPAPCALAGSAAFEAPHDAVESQLAEIWERVLGVERVGAKDNFFALGGHSLLAVEVHREIRRAMGAERLSVTDIFRFPVLETLAAHIAAPQAAGPSDPAEADRGGGWAAGLAESAEARAGARARRRAKRSARSDVDA